MLLKRGLAVPDRQNRSVVGTQGALRQRLCIVCTIQEPR